MAEKVHVTLRWHSHDAAGVVRNRLRSEDWSGTPGGMIRPEAACTYQAMAHQHFPLHDPGPFEQWLSRGRIENIE